MRINYIKTKIDNIMKNSKFGERYETIIHIVSDYN